MIRIVAFEALKMCWSLDCFVELFDLTYVKNIVSLGQCYMHRMNYIRHICKVFIADMLHDAESAGVVRTLKLKLILIIAKEERPVLQRLCWEWTLLCGILRLLSQLSLEFLGPVIGLYSEIWHDEDLAA